MTEKTEVSKSAETAQNEPARNEAALLPPVDVIEDANGITLYADCLACRKTNSRCRSKPTR
jgi:HSP20 family protein